MLTVTYDPVKVYDWLSAREQKGLDIEGTIDRFEGKVRKELMRWAHVEGVTFEHCAGSKTTISPDNPACNQMYTQISLLFIDCHFLRYNSPTAHAKALCKADYANLSASLIEDIVEAYQIPRADADLIMRHTGD